MAGNSLRGDVDSFTMSFAKRNRDYCYSIGIAGCVLAVVHVLFYIIFGLRAEKVKEFFELQKKLFIPALGIASAYMLNSYSIFTAIAIWFLVGFNVLAHIVCLFGTKTRKGIFKYVITLSHLSGIIFWIVHWILQINYTP